MSDPILEITFSGSIDESARSEILEPGQSWVSLENGRTLTRGAFDKRLGYAALSAERLDSTTRVAGNRLGVHRGAPYVIDGTVLDTYVESIALSVPHGRVPEASVRSRPTSSYAADTSNTTLLDCCVSGNVIVYAHSTSEAATLGTGSLVLAVEDVASGAVLRAPELIFTADPINFGSVVCAMATYSTFVFAVYLDDQTAGIYVSYLNTANVNAGWTLLGGSTFVVDNVIAGQGADALSAESLNDRIAFAYVNSSGGASQVTVWTLDIGGTIDGTTVNTSSVTPNLVTLEGSVADTLWIAWDETTSVKLKGIDATVLATVKASTLALLTLSSGTPSAIGVVSSGTAGHGRIIAGDGAHDRLQMRGFKTTAGAVAADGSQVPVPNAFVAGRPFRVGTRYYALFAPSPANVNNAQQAAVLCDFTEDQTWLRPVANLAPGLATMAIRARVESLSATRFITPIMVATSGAARATVLVTLDFAERGRWQSTFHNGVTSLSGGLLSYFDGARVAESGFVVRPPSPTTTHTGTSGSTPGTFRYVLVYEEVDAAGNWCVSSISDPSAPVTVTTATITVHIRPCSITARQRRTGGGEVRMVLYRTDITGVGIYYRLTSLPNDTGSPVTDYVDSTPDVTSNAQLYSPTLPGSGTALDRRAPPFCQAQADYNEMLVLASGSDLWWSGQRVSGEGTWFSPDFQVPVQDTGDITALAALDGTLYAFKYNGIYIVAGEAPSDNGAQGGLGATRKLACDVGCIDPNSIVVTSAGVFFQSTRGIELLSRSGAVTWIGERVRVTVETYPVVAAARLADREGGYVYFSLAAAESGGRVSGEGRDLVFDLAAGDWISLDDKQGLTAHQASQDAAIITIAGVPRYAWLGTDGAVYCQHLPDEDGANIDGDAWVRMAATTPWIHVAGLQGEQLLEQLLLLAERHTAHYLSISLAFDYVETFGTPRVFTTAEIATLAREWLVTEITQTTSTSVKVRIEDSYVQSEDYARGTGRGSTWIAMTIAGRAQRGPKRSSAAQRGGT